MQKLNKNYVYDLSELTSEEWKQITNSDKCTMCYYEHVEDMGWVFESNKSLTKEVVNAKELFYKSGWYKDERVYKWLAYRDFENECIYGFNGSEGEWFFSGNTLNHIDSEDVLATKEEVEERLIEEAKRRGFEDGIPVIDCDGVVNGTFVFQNNRLYLGGALIMQNGIWAEVVKKNLIEGVVTEQIVEFPDDLGENLKNLDTTNRTLIEGWEEPTLEEISSIFSSRKELSKKKVLKYLLKRNIILTPKQYKKLWKK